MMRFPMPHKLAEARYPGTVDEKLSCEVGTYVWMQENFPDIPIPHLVVFGYGYLTGGHGSKNLTDCDSIIPSRNVQYTYAIHRPFYIRVANIMRRRLLTFLRSPLVSRYTCNPTFNSLRTGYMIFEFIDPNRGHMLSDSWQGSQEDPIRRKNLFQGMDRLILSLARISQTRMSSFRYHSDGTISSTNRPLSCSTIILENNGALRIMQSNDTYTCTDAFVSDMLTFHNHRFVS